MKFTTTLAATILGLTHTISAIPTPGQTILPDNISIYHGFGGEIKFNSPYGQISRQQSGNDDISTLITFTFPEETRGRTCEFNFELNDAGSFTIAPGNNAFDVFRSTQVATEDSAGWGPPSNYRDVQLGRMKAVAGGQASVDWGTFTFPCPVGETKGFEVTPTGDSIFIQWNEPNDGPWIRYS